MKKKGGINLYWNFLKWAIFSHHNQTHIKGLKAFKTFMMSIKLEERKQDYIKKAFKNKMVYRFIHFLVKKLQLLNLSALNFILRNATKNQIQSLINNSKLISNLVLSLNSPDPKFVHKVFF